MAFTKRTLCALSTNGAVNVFTYRTDDADTVVETASYFDDAANTLSEGDFIHAAIDMDGTPEGKTYFVSDITSGVVTITFPTHA